jgi:glycosyltransferase involved in cell wall biosynthesis
MSNPYIDLLYGHMDPGRVTISDFRLRTAALKHYDILHLHWPEWSITGAPFWKSWARLLAFVFTLAVVRLRRTKVVWTVHNLRPHEKVGRARERLLYTTLSRLVHHQIHLTAATHDQMVSSGHECARTPFTVIEHGLLEEPSSFPGKNDARATLGLGPDKPVLLYFGGIQPYKRLDLLLDAFSRVKTDAILSVCGRPSTEALELDIRKRAAADPRVHLDLRFVPSDVLRAWIAAADVAVLPYISGLNTGTVFAALAAPTRILLPRTPTFEALRDSVGQQWIHLYDAPLTPEALTAAIAAAPSSPTTPDIASWGSIATATQSLYDSLRGWERA